MVDTGGKHHAEESWKMWWSGEGNQSIASLTNQADNFRFNATNNNRQPLKALGEKHHMIIIMSLSKKVNITNKIALKVHFYINFIVVRISVTLDKLLL